MKILLINYEYPPIGAGAATATEQIARALVRMGHEPVVLTAGFGKLQGQVVKDGIKVIRLPSRRRRIDASSISEMASFVLHASRRIGDLLASEKPDAIVAFFSIPCGPVAWWGTRNNRIPYIVSLRGGDVPGADSRVTFSHTLLAPLRRRVLKKACRVIANSEGLAQLAREEDGIPVEVVPNGVDTEFFRPADTRDQNSEHPFTFLFAGRFQPQKNLVWLLDQMAVVIKNVSRPIRLELIGDGPLRAQLEQQASALGIADRITWHGWVDRTRLRDLLWCADAFVNPSIYEGMPNTVLEAMASGLPVIASDVPGNASVVQDNSTGRLFALGDALSFQNIAASLASDPSKARAWGENGRKLVAENYSWDKTTATYLTHLKAGVR